MSWLSYALIPHHWSTRSIVVGIIAFTLGAGSTALAVRGFQGTEPVFHLCSANGGGVRLLSEGDTCKSQETAFDVPSKAYVDALAAADLGLQSNLDAETAARMQGDSDTLSAAKAFAERLVANETNLRTQSDSDEATARRQADADEAAARRQGDADTLAAANAYTDAHAGGSLALTILSTRVSNPAQLDPGGTLTASVSCGSGRRLIGGGASSSNSNVVLYQSFPASTLQWTASARAVGTVAAFGAGLTVFAVCAG